MAVSSVRRCRSDQPATRARQARPQEAATRPGNGTEYLMTRHCGQPRARPGLPGTTPTRKA
jgi:hypothetical protein